MAHYRSTTDIDNAAHDEIWTPLILKLLDIRMTTTLWPMKRKLVHLPSGKMHNLCQHYQAPVAIISVVSMILIMILIMIPTSESACFSDQRSRKSIRTSSTLHDIKS
jgi:hypothetical protein